MGDTGAARRPARIASQPARAGRSRPPDPVTNSASARHEPPLRDLDVDEIERTLTADDLRVPADPGERDRVENARRRLADGALFTELSAAGFEGPVFQVAETEFAAYGIAVLMAWTRTGQIFGKCLAKGRPLSDMEPRWSRDDRLEIAIETTARALKYFVENVLKAGRWDPCRGASLKTYFVGTCLLQFANVFELWVAEQRRWGQLHDDEATLDDGVGGGDPQWADPTAEAAVRTCSARECLRGIADRQTREAAWLVFGNEASHAEAGAAVGLSADAVEGRLYRLRRRQEE